MSSERDALAAWLTELESLPYEERPDAAAPALTAEQQATALDDIELQLRARLVHADAIGRQGRTAASARIIRDVNRWAEEHQHAYLLARSHRHLAVLLRTIGDYAVSLQHALRSVEHTDPNLPIPIRCDHELVLATAFGHTGECAAASARFAAIEKELAGTGWEWLHMAALNNIAYMHHDNGNPEQALITAERMVTESHRRGITLVPASIDTYGRTLLSAGRAAEAERVIAGMLLTDEHMVDPDGLGYCLLTLAAARRELGKLPEAHAALDDCERLCNSRDLGDVRVRAHQERAEIYAAEGRFQQAYEEHKRYAAAAAALTSSEQAGRAKIAQAVFETAEARKDSERFRMLSLHDPLTGLFNRRYVDEQLGPLLMQAARSGTPLSVALVDLDHFKRINDNYSHETGDAVLVAIARIFEGHLPERGVAVRMGGEEFLLILPDMDESAAVRWCSGIRNTLHSHPWGDVAPGAVVTASFGVAAAAPADGDGAVSLLRRTDANLYQAKQTGRDRIVAAKTNL